MNTIKEKIETEIKKDKIVIFMKGTPQAPQCGFSAATCDVFNQLGAKYHAINVLEDTEIREGIKQFTNWPTIPQVFINGKFVGGCDITRELFETGELKKMVEQNA